MAMRVNAAAAMLASFAGLAPLFMFPQPVAAPPPTGGGGGGGPPQQGAPDGQTAPTETSTTSCVAGSTPCPCSALGDVGLTTASGTDARSQTSFSPGENIYGPFEAGFSAQQDGILAGLGCTSGHGYVSGGIDTMTAEQIVAQDCGVTLPRVESGQYVSLLDECGGHTQEYHFHERLACLYSASSGSAHSTNVGEGSDGKLLYGKWEDFSSTMMPKLDACGGHFGVTPDSSGAIIYHYHVQDLPPFTFGCFGPITSSDGNYKLVTMAECRAAYPDACADGDVATVLTPTGSVSYDLWCPCFDDNGLNTGNTERSVFSESSSVWTCVGSGCVGVISSVSTGESTTGSVGSGSDDSSDSGNSDSVSSGSTVSSDSTLSSGGSVTSGGTVTSGSTVTSGDTAPSGDSSVSVSQSTELQSGAPASPTSSGSTSSGSTSSGSTSSGSTSGTEAASSVEGENTSSDSVPSLSGPVVTFLFVAVFLVGSNHAF